MPGDRAAVGPLPIRGRMGRGSTPHHRRTRAGLRPSPKFLASPKGVYIVHTPRLGSPPGLTPGPGHVIIRLARDHPETRTS